MIRSASTTPVPTPGGEFSGEGGNTCCGPTSAISSPTANSIPTPTSGGPEATASPHTWLVHRRCRSRPLYRPFGQDNVPHRASRFWIGIWFPASGLSRSGRLGRRPRLRHHHPRHRVGPHHPDLFTGRHLWEAENGPNGFYASPDQYPRWPGTGGVAMPPDYPGSATTFTTLSASHVPIPADRRRSRASSSTTRTVATSSPSATPGTHHAMGTEVPWLRLTRDMHHAPLLVSENAYTAIRVGGSVAFYPRRGRDRPIVNP